MMVHPNLQEPGTEQDHGFQLTQNPDTLSPAKKQNVKILNRHRFKHGYLTIVIKDAEPERRVTLKFTTWLLDQDVGLGAREDYEPDDLDSESDLERLMKKHRDVDWMNGVFKVDASGWDEALS